MKHLNRVKVVVVTATLMCHGWPRGVEVKMEKKILKEIGIRSS